MKYVCIFERILFNDLLCVFLVVGAGFEPCALALKGPRVKPTSLTDHCSGYGSRTQYPEVMSLR